MAMPIRMPGPGGVPEWISGFQQITGKHPFEMGIADPVIAHRYLIGDVGPGGPAPHQRQVFADALRAPAAQPAEPATSDFPPLDAAGDAFQPQPRPAAAKTRPRAPRPPPAAFTPGADMPSMVPDPAAPGFGPNVDPLLARPSAMGGPESPDAAAPGAVMPSWFDRLAPATGPAFGAAPGGPGPALTDFQDQGMGNPMWRQMLARSLWGG